MEDRHKQILRRNRVALVEKLKPPDLYDALLEKRVFSQDMIDEIKVRLCTVLCAQEQVPSPPACVNTSNTTCYGCSAQAPGGIRPGSWS